MIQVNTPYYKFGICFIGSIENFEDSFSGSDYSAGAIAVSFYSGFWAFGGW